MSRSYRISLSESLQQHIHVEDGVRVTLDILPILPQERLAALLVNELSQLGFERQENVLVRTDDDGLEVRVDLEDWSLTIKLTKQSDVTVETTKSMVTYEEQADRDREKLIKQTQLNLKKRVAKHKQELQEQVTQAVEKKLSNIRAEINEAINHVTGQALKEKAATLGEIEEISEDEQSGSLTIRVRL